MKTRLPAGRQGFALIIAVIFMSVMLTFGLALGSLAYKQEVLSSSAVESQYAFYAADAGLECLLYADQQLNTFVYPSDPSSAPLLQCDGIPATYSPTYPTGIVSYVAGTKWVVSERLSLDSGKHCVDVTISKPAASGGMTSLYSQGYDVSCSAIVNEAANPSGVRFVSRGLQAHY